MLESGRQFTGDLRLRKLHWLCRRGMKELDVLLEHFIKNQRVALCQDGWPELEGLLAMEDDQLWDLIQIPANAPVDYQQVLKQINHGLARID